MSLKGKPVVVETTHAKPEEKAETFVAGKTFVQYTVVYADDKGTVLDITPDRGEAWLKDDAVILNQRQGNALRIFAQKTQAFIGFTGTNEALVHLHDRTFQVKATDAVKEFIGDNSHIGGKTQVAFFKAKSAAAKAVRPAYMKAYKKAFAAELAEI